MKVGTQTVTICRHIGKVLKEEYSNIREMDVEEFYAPLVKIIGEKILKNLQ